MTYNTYVYCPNCDTRGRRAILSHFPTNVKAREHVIEAWNRRAELEAVIPIIIAEQERMFQEVTRIEAERLERAMQGSKFCPPEMELVGVEMNPKVTKWLEKIAREEDKKMLDLKPCPFCGGEPYFLKPRHEKGTAFDTMMIECKHCGALPYGVSVYDGKKEEDKKAVIAKFWNRRSNDWISVNDRLPEEECHGLSKRVLVTDGEDVNIEWYDYHLKVWDCEGYSPVTDEKFWMPFPELPEVNEDDQPRTM